MHQRSSLKLTALLWAASLAPYAQAHPGHEHSSGMLAGLVHALAEWGPLLAVLVLMVAAGHRLWKARAR